MLVVLVIDCLLQCLWLIACSRACGCRIFFVLVCMFHACSNGGGLVLRANNVFCYNDVGCQWSIISDWEKNRCLKNHTVPNNQPHTNILIR